MATVKLVLDKRRKDLALIDPVDQVDKNKYPLVLRIYKGDPYRDISLKYNFTMKEWPGGDKGVHTSVTNSKRVYASIQKRFSIATVFLSERDGFLVNLEIDSIRDLVIEEINKQINGTEVAQPLVLNAKEATTIYLGTYGKSLIERTRTKKKFKTALWYEDGIRAIKNFNANRDINTDKESNDDKENIAKKDVFFHEITIAFLEDFEAAHLAKGNGKNGAGAYLRAIRSITNKYVKEGLNGKHFEGYPWGRGGYSIPHEKTKKRAVKKDVITDIRKLELKAGSALWHAKNYFLWMFNNRGMNFIDIAKLKAEQIIEAKYKEGLIISGRLEYKRSKNGRDFTIKLTQESLHILNSYQIGKKSGGDFVFPIGFENTKSGIETYSKKRKRYNGYFNELAVLIKQPGLNLTSYVIRHTWATVAKKSGVAIAIIGEGLGHEDAKTTDDYLGDFDNDILDDANELIVA